MQTPRRGSWTAGAPVDTGAGQNRNGNDCGRKEEWERDYGHEYAGSWHGRETDISRLFSCTGTTGQLAEYAAEILGADLYEIKPEDPYTAEEDLAYNTNGRADQEQNDPSARPAISGSVENMEKYDTVLIGYPIWHGQAPRIISTF